MVPAAGINSEKMWLRTSTTFSHNNDKTYGPVITIIFRSSDSFASDEK